MPVHLEWELNGQKNIGRGGDGRKNLRLFDRTTHINNELHQTNDATHSNNLKHKQTLV